MERLSPACRPNSRWLTLCMLPVFLILCLSVLVRATPAFAASVWTCNEWSEYGIFNWGQDVNHAYATDSNNFTIWVCSSPLTENEEYQVSIYDSNGKYLESITTTPDPGGSVFLMGDFSLINDYRLQAGYAAAVYGTPWTIKVTDLSNNFIASVPIYVNYNGYGGGDGRTPTSISASPNPVSVLKGGAQQLSLQENFSSGNPVDITGTGLYTSADTSKVTVSSSGLITGEAETTTPVVVTINWDGLTTTDPVTVCVVTSITASPNPVTVSPSGMQQLKVTANTSGGITPDVTSSASYTSSATSIAAVSDTGLITGEYPGSATITVSYGGKSTTVQVTVTNPAVSITASPSSMVLAMYGWEQVWVTATLYDGSTTDVTAIASYISEDGSIASVWNWSAYDYGVWIDGEATGNTSIDISYEGCKTSVPVTVTTVEFITASPSSMVLAIGGTQPLTVTATMADGSTTDVTVSASYSSSDTNIASVSDSGQVYGVAEGNTYIDIIYEGYEISVYAAVVPPVDHISARPKSIKMLVGDTRQLDVTATMPDGSTTDVTSNTTFTSENTDVATVTSGPEVIPSVYHPGANDGGMITTALYHPDDYGGASYGAFIPGIVPAAVSEGLPGLVTGVAPGSTYIDISYANGYARVPVTVVSPVVSLAASPNPVDLTAGNTQPLTVTATIADESTADVTSSVYYRSSDKSVATVSDSGLVTGVAGGSATITVIYSHQGWSDRVTTTVTVNVTQTFTVTYDGNGYTGGSVPADNTAYTAGQQVTVKDAGDMVRDNYTFIGWNTQSNDGGESYTPGATFDIEADITLYAEWSGGGGVESFPILSAKPSYFEQL